jgi:hypothetical protein
MRDIAVSCVGVDFCPYRGGYLRFHTPARAHKVPAASESKMGEHTSDRSANDWVARYSTVCI